jgi:hypothetical protein
MWVRFNAPFTFRPRYGVLIEYQPGQVKNVTTPCGTQAIKKGKAVKLRAPRKGEKPSAG